MPDAEQPSEHNGQEDVQHNEVIATAMRASLIVLMIMGLPVIGFLIYLNLQKIRETKLEVDERTPAVRESTEPQLPLLDETGTSFFQNSGRSGEQRLSQTMGS